MPKEFKPITSKNRLSAICNALNVIFWKVPSVTEDTDSSGEWWAAELQDKDIHVKWDRKTQTFVPEER